jgi:hypothetical protein
MPQGKVRKSSKVTGQILTGNGRMRHEIRIVLYFPRKGCYTRYQNRKKSEGADGYGISDGQRVI